MKLSSKSHKRMAIALVLPLALLLLLPVVGGCAPPAEETVEWRMQAQYPESLFTAGYQSKTIVETINERCAGKLHITWYGPGQLVPTNEMYVALSEGTYHVAYGSLIRYSGRLPEAFVNFGLPMGWHGYDEVYEFFYDYGYLDVMRKACARENIFYAAPAPCGDLLIISSFPCRTAADLQGKNIFVAGTNAIVIEKLGGSPVMFDMSELYMALKLGTVDGAVHCTWSLADAKYDEVCKYATYPSLVYPLVNDFIINLDSWNALPDDVQKTIEDVLREVCPMTSQKCEEHDLACVSAAEEHGVEFITLSDSEVAKFAAASMEAWDVLAQKDPKAAETVEMLRDFVKSKGR